MIFAPAANANGPGYASFTFQVQDDGGTANGGVNLDQSPNTITVNVTPVNDAPDITSNGGGQNATVSVAEGTTPVTTVTASDVDNASLGFSIVGGEDAGDFLIDASGHLAFRVTPDFEKPSDVGGDNDYKVMIQASDGSLTDAQLITVLVTDVQQPPRNGSSRADTLVGDVGDDTLNGRLGKDKLTGGAGEDAFQFTTKLGKNNIDHITDFTANNDTIELSHRIFKALLHPTLPTELSAAEFRIGTKAKDKDDHIIYDKKHGGLYYDSDGKGGHAAIQFAVLDNHSHLSASDFLII